MIQCLPTGEFRWLKDSELNQIDLGKYKDDGKKGLILKVDLEYPKELHDLHNDLPLAPQKMKVTNEMLSNYCKGISDKCNLGIGKANKLITCL